MLFPSSTIELYGYSGKSKILDNSGMVFLLIGKRKHCLFSPSSSIFCMFACLFVCLFFELTLYDISLELEYVLYHIIKDLAYIVFCVRVYVKETFQFSHLLSYYHIHTEHFTSNTEAEAVDFSLTRQLCNTSWVSCSFTEL